MDTELYIPRMPPMPELPPILPASQRFGNTLRPCPACGNTVSKKAKACPACGHPITKKRETGKIIALVILLGFFLFGCLPYALQSISASAGADQARDESSHAYFAAYKFCERYAPSGKNFTTDSGADATEGRAEWLADQNNWYATGYVDAQNKFGAMRHEHWAAHVKIAGGNWTCTFLDIGGETIIGGD
jgi:hypothetical protein